METEEKNKMSAKPESLERKAFGLPEEDRAMLPGESKVPAGNVLKPRKTTGEKFYDILQLSIGQVLILFFTAVIAYIAKYGKDTYGPVPNLFKKFQGWMYDKLLNNKLFPLAEKGEFANRVVGAVSSSVVLFHGGNLFAPVMRSMENNREKIATYVNKRWGKPGEVEAGHERLKDAPKQSWGDVIKGRMVAFLMVFSSFTVIDTVLGKDGNGKYALDKYEDWFGRKVAGLTKDGKLISKTPISQGLSPEQNQNKAYMFSKILALDLFATSAAITIWNLTSRFFAKKHSKPDQTVSSADPAHDNGKTESHTYNNQMKETLPDHTKPDGKASFAERLGSGPKDYTSRAMESPVANQIM